MRAQVWRMLAAAILCAAAAAAAEDCSLSPDIAANVSAEQVVHTLSAMRRKVVTFGGYSGAEYEDPAAMLAAARRVLEQYAPDQTLISIGATASGIGAVYAQAKQMGFTTVGIVSMQAKAQHLPLATCVDHVFYVTDSSWGGYVQGTRTLTPTSEAIVASSDVVVTIGGGDVTRDEALEAQRRGKPVTFIPADMNHRLAREKAAAKGQPGPTDFRGSAHAALAPRETQ